ncbi:ABC transporter permease [Tepidimicrobium xylanilyticum]|uniref:Peptide/nickel transport system permease protein n=1 Tax=Tepidimicrobium xylanilyticum TaxID=1123352 RepID=A0A1H2Q342_9FIRM|nr:ABC transporter permease [Tepidimicrobium xylanilyticum]GMG95766.1 peptide ABC transporter permease [Tepidimicrobium xylanilyticum]SDW01575.1 peptide/nickel transport system permease protein [Tepidimicrobium xylanilyticum]
MKRYILKRVLLSIAVLLGVITITFIIARIIPSDPAAKWVGPRATPEQIKAAEEELGLNDPLPVQYINYLKDLAKGDLGKSLRTHRPVTDDLKTFVPPTLELVLLAFIIAIIIGIPLGIYSAKKKDQLLDHISRLFSIGAVSLPTFWVAMILQLIFYKKLGLFPIGGRVSMETAVLYELPNVTGMLILDCILTGHWFILKDVIWHIVLPCITIALYPIGLVARMTRSALLEILNEDYITAARSYGLKERLVLWRYALKNTLGATATVVTLSLGYTLVNTFLVETIFSWPGLGNYVATSVVTLDYPAILGVTIFAAACYIILNLIADIIIALDPRVRL